ncbi:MAG: hypothetical protein LAN37_03350 [Acidobacteriia bacterium]|nr:hypothetical protein [Terriglobia bacterium]
MIIATAAKGPVDEFLRANPWVIPLFVVAWGWLVISLVARLSGWSLLAERYGANAPFEGEKWYFQSVQMRYLSHYNNCLTFGGNAQGLYVAMFFLLRAGHPPLLIPWEELEIEPKKRFFVTGYELRFRQVPGVYMWVWAKLGEKIVRASQNRVPGVRLAPQIG